MEQININLLTLQQISKLTGIKDRKLRDLVRTGFLRRANVPGREIMVFEVDVFSTFRPIATPSNNNDRTS